MHFECILNDQSFLTSLLLASLVSLLLLSSTDMVAAGEIAISTVLVVSDFSART